MSDQELITIQSQQFAQLATMLTAISNALWAINDQLKPIDNVLNKQTLETTKWQSIQNESIIAGFALVAEAVAKGLPPPPGPPAHVEFVKFVFPGLKESE